MSILPTVSLAKLEELNLSLKRIGNQKLELEIINKKLRNDSHENQIRLDNYILREKNLLDLEETLKNRYPDELSLKIVELSEKLSTYKLESLKAQREVSLVREREEYYMRVNKTQTDQIQTLEEQVAKNDEKFVQREGFWRERHQDQMKLLSKVAQKDGNRESGSDLNSAQINERVRDGVSSLSKEDREVMVTATPNMRSATNLMSHSALDMDNQIMKDKIRFLEDDVRLREIKIQKLEKELDHKQVGVNYRTDNVETLVISDLEAKTRDIAQAAQHTVQTLQMMVDDKTQLLNDKEKKIDVLRYDLTEKAKLLSRLELENENLRRQVSAGERWTHKKLREWSLLMSKNCRYLQSNLANPRKSTKTCFVN
jgi:Coiled-coil region of centrosome protein CE290